MNKPNPSRDGIRTGPAPARRMADIEPFHVMALLGRARELESQGRSIIHMEIGEPDFPTPQPVVDAAIAAIRTGDVHYTPSLGLTELREAISRFYSQRYGIEVPTQRIVVTPGASGALLLAMGLLIGPGDEVMMADPCYPCNRHFVRLMEGVPACIPVDGSTAYQLTSEIVERGWTDKTRAVMLASPSNPTGTLVPRHALEGIARLAESRGAALIMDEIYHGLVYGDGDDADTALSVTDQAFVINSFSKYFHMTGWRLGWLVVPQAFTGDAEKLAQNIFLAPSTPAQLAALAVFQPGTIAILEQRRREFQTRRDYLLEALRGLGFSIPVTPRGAFYLYADCSGFTRDSQAFAQDLLERSGVCITPGLDFGVYRSERHVRFAYTTSLDNLREGVARIGKFLRR